VFVIPLSDLLTIAGRDLCLDAFNIAIDTTVDKRGRWYTSMTTLEFICVDLCMAYRSSWSIPQRTVVVSIDACIPPFGAEWQESRVQKETA